MVPPLGDSWENWKTVSRSQARVFFNVVSVVKMIYVGLIFAQIRMSCVRICKAIFSEAFHGCATVFFFRVGVFMYRKILCLGVMCRAFLSYIYFCVDGRLSLSVYTSICVGCGGLIKLQYSGGFDLNRLSSLSMRV